MRTNAPARVLVLQVAQRADDRGLVDAAQVVAQCLEHADGRVCGRDVTRVVHLALVLALLARRTRHGTALDQRPAPLQLRGDVADRRTVEGVAHERPAAEAAVRRIHA
jgi:hypothetical protein